MCEVARSSSSSLAPHIVILLTEVLNIMGVCDEGEVQLWKVLFCLCLITVTLWDESFRHFAMLLITDNSSLVAWSTMSIWSHLRIIVTVWLVLLCLQCLTRWSWLWSVSASNVNIHHHSNRFLSLQSSSVDRWQRLNDRIDATIKVWS